MRVERVIRALIDRTNLLLGCTIVGKRRPEVLSQRGQEAARIVFSSRREFLHPCGNLRRILRQMIEQPLEVA